MAKINLKHVFKKDLGVKNILIDELMKKHTSFRTGGPADILVMPKNEEELLKIMNICNNNSISFFIMGNGTNLLVSDKGIRGVVIKLGENFSDIDIEGEKIVAESGALLTVVSKKALKYSLKGLEFASGIPGTIGGAITMNAGAYGGEMKDIVKKVKVLNKKGKIIEYDGEEMNFRYRGSRVQDEELIVLEVEMELEKGNYEEINEKMIELTRKRTSRQPLDLPSAGSTFKRPEGHFAGKLIEDSGLRGLRFRGAQVSEKHCGFIVNRGEATSKEIETLIKIVQKVVKNRYNVFLEPELKIIGQK